MDRIRILLAEDHALLRELLKAHFSAQSDLEVVAEAGTAEAIVREAESTQPHVILLDISLPSCSGIGLIPELRQRAPQSRIVMLTMHDDPTYLRSSLAAGAAGYVVKSSMSDVLIDAIRTVHQGRTYVDPSLRHLQIDASKPTSPMEPVSIARLSDRERQVLVWLSQGLRYQAIAEKMGVSVKTVETYRSRLTTKLGFKDRADLMRFAIDSGILVASVPGK